MTLFSKVVGACLRPAESFKQSIQLKLQSITLPILFSKTGTNTIYVGAVFDHVKVVLD